MPWTRSVDPGSVVNAPLRVVVPLQTSVPALVTGPVIGVVPSSVSEPSFVIAPVPPRVQVVHVHTPCAPITYGPETVSLRLVPVSVCVPLDAPFTRNAATV